jgi:hypothetical protein
MRLKVPPQRNAAPLFISYRRDDTAGYARALNDVLAQQFGAERVFIDVDDIAAGQAFDQTIAQALHQARVLLVLIGPRWLAPHGRGAPRLHSPDDFVHRELAAGLQAGLQVIPLLFDGASMPAEQDLPAPLRALASRQALVMDARRFAADTEHLLAVLRSALGAPAAAAPAGPGRRQWLLGAGAGGLLLATGGAWWAGRPGPAVPTFSRPAINGVWQAQVRYDWPGADFRETLRLEGEGQQLRGSVSFLRVPRGILAGVVDAQGLRFETESSEQSGAGPERTVRHRYTGQLVGDVLQLVMQTEGASQPHQPVQISARQVQGPP